MKIFYACLLVVGLSFNLSAFTVTAPAFENPGEEFTESGYVKLSWIWNAELRAGGDYRFELEQDTEGSFPSPRQIYQGQDFATFLSGLKNGQYYYRIRVVAGSNISSWSAPIRVQVQHHSLSLAFALFGLGALVFLLTVAIVVQGNRKAAQNI